MFGLQVLYPLHTAAAGFPAGVTEFLQHLGHNVSTLPKDDTLGVVQGVLVDASGTVTAHSDSRKQGRAVVVDVGS